ncbi:MAG TPA: PCYCGC motif-containing (lipo)protein [Bacillota bacterium]|nr:PCYCGC motif-containing (lipo)protein [Bacillota bacterium]
MRWKLLIPIFLLASTLLTACSESPKLQENQTVVNGDIREPTTSKDVLPVFLKDTNNQQITSVYVTASKHTDLLQYMPCYCGCGESVGHMSNLDCFIHETKQDGSLVWDSHGTTCNTCMAIAAEASSMQDQGKSYKEIREFIDNKYKEGYAKPTPTPLPPAGK